MYIDAEERKKELLEQNELEGGVMFKIKDAVGVEAVARGVLPDAEHHRQQAEAGNAQLFVAGRLADEPRRQHNVRVGPRQNVEPVADQIPQEPARQAAHRRRREGPEPPVLQAELLPQIAKVVFFSSFLIKRF